ncbi:MAG: hypothetical protein KDA31_00890 [Phycisphaerales bacterium]|nr:hypothetical protein [Phycisphaerales bacterium]MCB9837458.1 hypothetical protein [Phycisphaera sp.]
MAQKNHLKPVFGFMFLATCSAKSQPLNEIEAWVFEETVGRPGVGYGAIRPFFLPDQSIAGAVILDPHAPLSFAQPYTLDEQGFHPLPMPPSTKGFLDLLSDQRGNLYAHTIDFDHLPALTPTMWASGIPQSVHGVEGALVSLEAVSPAGRGIGRISMPASSTTPTALAVWSDTQLPPDTIPLPVFPLAGMTEDSQFIPRMLTDAGDAAGVTVDQQGNVISFAWLLNDGTTIEFPIETHRLESNQVYYTAFEPTGDGNAIVATRIHDAMGLNPQHHAYRLTQDGLEPIWSSNGPNAVPTFVTSSTGAYLIQSQATVLITDGQIRRDISDRIATAMPVAALSDMADDFTILTVLGILRPTTCLADTNRDHVLDAGDLATWLDAYRAGAGIADQNLDRRLTPADFSAWVIRYNKGCDFGG